MLGDITDTVVTVRPFRRNREGDDVIIGDMDRQVFLAVPPEAVEILDGLAAGRTVGQVAADFEQRHGEIPDIAGFLDVLELEGFVARDGAPLPADTRLSRSFRRSWNLGWLSQRTAARLLSWPVLTLAGLIIAVGAILLVQDAALFPGPHALVYREHFAALFCATTAFVLLGIAIHELSHVVAARAVGVPARIGISNQMYVLVAQTDMSGIWLAPKRRRYLAFVIGAVVDAATFSGLLIALYAQQRGWLDPPSWLVLLIKGVSVGYATRLIWQLFLFLRTDGYYVIAAAFDCRNLLGDTQDLLRNRMARLLRRPAPVDQSAVPPRELRVIKVYALVYLLGRAVMLLVFVSIVLPVLGIYATEAWKFLGGRPSMFGKFDVLTVALVLLVFDLGGVWLWLAQGLRAGRRRIVARRTRSTG